MNTQELASAGDATARRAIAHSTAATVFMAAASATVRRNGQRSSWRTSPRACDKSRQRVRWRKAPVIAFTDTITKRLQETAPARALLRRYATLDAP